MLGPQVPPGATSALAGGAAAHLAAPLAHLGLLLAAVVTGFWAAGSLALHRRYALTPYKEGTRWWLVLAWPLLMLVSPKFRQDVMAAVGRRRQRPAAGAAGATGQQQSQAGEAAAEQRQQQDQQ